MKALSNDLRALDDILQRFDTVLKQPGFGGTPAQFSLLAPLQQPLENLETTLENLTVTVKPFTKTTGDSKSSKWRGLAWTFREKEITALKSELMAYKASLEIALSIATLLVRSQRPSVQE